MSTVMSRLVNRGIPPGLSLQYPRAVRTYIKKRESKDNCWALYPETLLDFTPRRTVVLRATPDDPSFWLYIAPLSSMFTWGQWRLLNSTQTNRLLDISDRRYGGDHESI